MNQSKTVFDPILFSAFVGDLCEIEKDGMVSTTQVATTIMRKAIQAQLEVEPTAVPMIALTPDLVKSLKIVRDAATACDNDDPDFIFALDTAMTAVDQIVYAAHEAERG